MQHLRIHVIQKADAENAKPCDCNYDDNYYGDQVCVKTEQQTINQ